MNSTEEYTRCCRSYPVFIPDTACHFDGDFDADLEPDPTFTFDADAYPDPGPSLQLKAQNLEKVSQIGSYCIPYILACRLQIDADPDPDPAYHCDAGPDPAYHFDADPQHWASCQRTPALFCTFPREQI